MATLGYARVSGSKEALDEQVKILEEHGYDKLFTDFRYRSGTNLERNGLRAMLEYAREGDVVAVCKLDRLAISMQDLQNITDEFQERGINLISFTENINTSSETGHVVFEWIGIFAGFEKEILSERIRTGINNAREKGVKLGRKETNIPLKEKAYKMYGSGNYTMKEITELTGLSRATIYRYIDQRKASE